MRPVTSPSRQNCFSKAGYLHCRRSVLSYLEIPEAREVPSLLSNAHHMTTNKRRRTMEKSAWKWISMLSFVALISSFVTVSGSANAWAKEKRSALEKQIQGTWTLVSIFVEKDGEKIDVFGANPRGSMILTPNGRFSVIMMTSSLPKFTAGSRIKGTTEENQAVVKGSLVWFGSYKIADAKEHIVVFTIEGSTFPNWAGEEQKLFMNVEGDEMKVINPAAAIGGKGYPTWKRIK